MVRTCLAALFVFCLAVPAAAQPSISGSIGPGVSAITGSDGATREIEASVGFEHLLKSERVRLFYEFDTGDFATPGSWRYLVHSAGGTYRFNLGEKGTDYLYVGGDGTARRNGDSWSAADYNAVGAFTNLELHPGRATVRSGYRIDTRRFPSSPALDQLQHSVFGSVLVSTPTRTTFIGEVVAGAKHYEAVSARTEVVAVWAEGAVEGHGPGYGRGSGLANATLVPVVTPGAPGSDARHVTFFGRVAQSLATRTGLLVEASRRHVWGEIPPALVATPASFFDDGIYDDLFASNTTRGTVSLKSIVGSGIDLAASGTWLDKDYPATFAFDDEGVPLDGVLRSDRVMQGRFDAVWPLFPSRTGSVSLDLITGYEYTNHRSTSALYRYTSHAMRFAIGITY